ncbi:MAG: CoA pyrophosphatase [Alcaligenaceae bacterium]|jgi:8-oxo-dGTP pyrophosphatase MutT (NUDIX family)|nr:CoA pyrophosphatase [Alcaligenaceae bacterium]
MSSLIKSANELIPPYRTIPDFDPFNQPSQCAGLGLPIIGDDELPDLLDRAFLPEYTWYEDQLVVDWNSQKEVVKSSFIEAGVLIPIVYRDDQPQVVLTKRSSKLRNHRGQISFPGGRFEDKDKDLQDAALRETEEEIGIARSKVSVFGEMPIFYTGTGYAMSSYLGWLAEASNFVIDTKEVEEVFLVPLSFLTDPNNYRLYTVTGPDSTFSYYGLNWDHHFIWGATASILRNLYQRIRQAR